MPARAARLGRKAAARAAKAALPIARAAGKASLEALPSVSSALTSDLVVIRTQTTHGRGKKKKPVDLEFHLNPLGIGTAVVGTGLALWLLQLRLAPSLTEVEYGKWVWPSDSTDASKELVKAKRGAAPSRASGSPVTGWYVIGGPFTPYIQVSEGTPGAVQMTVTPTEVATWSPTETRTETHIAVRSRQGFLGNGEGTDTSDTDKWWLTPGWKLIARELTPW